MNVPDSGMDEPAQFVQARPQLLLGAPVFFDRLGHVLNKDAAGGGRPVRQMAQRFERVLGREKQVQLVEVDVAHHCLHGILQGVRQLGVDGEELLLPDHGHARPSLDGLELGHQLFNRIIHSLGPSSSRHRHPLSLGHESCLTTLIYSWCTGASKASSALSRLCRVAWPTIFTTPMTTTKMTAKITAYSAMSWPASSMNGRQRRHNLRTLRPLPLAVSDHDHHHDDVQAPQNKGRRALPARLAYAATRGFFLFPYGPGALPQSPPGDRGRRSA